MKGLNRIVAVCAVALLGGASAKASMLYEFKFAGDYANTGTLGGVGTVAGWSGTATIGLSSDNPYSSATGQSLALSSTAAEAKCLAISDGGALQMDNTKCLSIAAWINPTLSMPSNGIVSRSNASDQGWSFQVGSNGALLLGGELWTGQSPAGVVKANQWQYVGFTWDGVHDGVTFYVNGNAVTTVNVGLGTEQAATPVEIGARNAGPYWGLNGNIDTVRIWDELKTSADMQAMYQAEVPESATCALVTVGSLGPLARRRRHA